MYFPFDFTVLLSTLFFSTRHPAHIDQLCTRGIKIDITSPGPDAPWTENASGNVTWTSTAIGPPDITVLVANHDPSVLAAPLAIVAFQNLLAETFTWPKVELAPADGYQVQFADTLNNSKILAESGPFTVLPPN
ncbi:hypothetical protein EIP91_006589 [Steccherinum ochraceum]|uniref:Yeast cell wall synthesis Kre9/Knh1-like N-terminal domain-containing protein n=1 Tax=Steccherinum ochraceum TaxID=92696 RepID=A0A4V2MVJ0_9APHY|nr:hypothetical protein EIP91_006589 [Steccherinum ochraceum]